jgi:hypothetical protein
VIPIDQDSSTHPHRIQFTDSDVMVQLKPRRDGETYFPTDQGDFIPTPNQVLEIQHILTQVLPPELSYPIIEAAGYPPPVVVERQQPKTFPDRRKRGGNDIWKLWGKEENRMEFEEHWVYLESDGLWGPVRSSESKPQNEITGAMEDGAADHALGSVANDDSSESLWHISNIVITTLSRDQGWSDTPEFRGTYQHSYTWFEIAIKRRSESGGSMEYLPGDFEIQRNKHAFGEYMEHTVKLPLGDPFFQRLQKGDVLVLLAKAQFQVSASVSVKYTCVTIVLI